MAAGSAGQINKALRPTPQDACSIAPQPSEMQSAMTQLHDTLVDADMALAGLTERLGPVLMPPSPEAQCRSEPLYGAELPNEIARQAIRVRALFYQIGDLRDRLCL